MLTFQLDTIYMYMYKRENQGRHKVKYTTLISIQHLSVTQLFIIPWTLFSIIHKTNMFYFSIWEVHAHVLINRVEKASVVKKQNKMQKIYTLYKYEEINRKIRQFS